jgi:hypothetical protein
MGEMIRHAIVIATLLLAAPHAGGREQSLYRGKALKTSESTISLARQEKVSTQVKDPPAFILFNIYEKTDELQQAYADDLVSTGPRDFALPATAFPDPAKAIASRIRNELIDTFRTTDVTPGNTASTITDDAEIVVNVDTAVWQLMQTTIFSRPALVYMARISIVENPSGVLLLESTCSFWNWSPVEKRPFFVPYLTEPEGAISSDLSRAAETCVEGFTRKSLGKSSNS